MSWQVKKSAFFYLKNDYSSVFDKYVFILMFLAVLLQKNSVLSLMIHFMFSVNNLKFLIMDLIIIGGGVCGFSFALYVVFVSFRYHCHLLLNEQNDF